MAANDTGVPKQLNDAPVKAFFCSNQFAIDAGHESENALLSLILNKAKVQANIVIPLF